MERRVTTAAIYRRSALIPQNLGDSSPRSERRDRAGIKHEAAEVQHRRSQRVDNERRACNRNRSVLSSRNRDRGGSASLSRSPPVPFYLRDVRREMFAPYDPGPVAMVAMDSPSVAMKRLKVGPPSTVRLPCTVRIDRVADRGDDVFQHDLAADAASYYVCPLNRLH